MGREDSGLMLAYTSSRPSISLSPFPPVVAFWPRGRRTAPSSCWCDEGTEHLSLKGTQAGMAALAFARGGGQQEDRLRLAVPG